MRTLFGNEKLNLIFIKRIEFKSINMSSVLVLINRIEYINKQTNMYDTNYIDMNQQLKANKRKC